MYAPLIVSQGYGFAQSSLPEHGNPGQPQLHVDVQVVEGSVTVRVCVLRTVVDEPIVLGVPCTMLRIVDVETGVELLRPVAEPCVVVPFVDTGVGRDEADDSVEPIAVELVLPSVRNLCD